MKLGPHTARTVLISAALALPLALAGCGSDEDSQQAASSASSGVSSARGSSSASSESTGVGEKQQRPDGQKPSGEPSPGNPAPPAGAPNGGGGAPDRPGAVPVQGSDQDQIRSIVNGLGNTDRSAADYQLYIADNSCTAYLDANGGMENLRQNAEGARDRPASEVAPRITGVDPITVNGERATATVTVEQNGSPATQDMQFARENGRWTICPS
ncbi:Rv0361 family membrane protein [Corynebacterium heidelbergense]|uniref:Rv0361 family membrane protein n=1 Tax=Corynebacterium heidelbergense TaxID=2055947 RepID=UPI0010579E4D|nr:hypothetical protein [Corynebacterium heidelbergense]